MKIKRKDKEEGSEKRDLTKKVGIASSSIVGSGIGALSGYGLSRIGEEKRKKKIATEIEQKRLEDIGKQKHAAELYKNPERVEALKRSGKFDECIRRYIKEILDSELEKAQEQLQQIQ